MSSGASGTVLLVPIAAVAGLAAAGVALGAVAIAGVGFVLVREGGRQLIACGSELKKMADENLAVHQALQKATQQYEIELLRRAARTHTSEASIREEIAKQRTIQAETRRALEQISNQMRKKEKRVSVDWTALETSREQVLGTVPPSLTQHQERLTGWGKKVEQLKTFANQIDNVLAQFVSGADQGLFVTTQVERRYQETQERISALEKASTSVITGKVPPDADTYQSLIEELDVLDRQLAFWRKSVPERRKQQAEAFGALERARTALEQAQKNTTEDSHLLGLQIASETLQDSIKAFQDCQFVRALLAASAVHQHLETMERTLELQRIRNLELFLARLYTMVSPLRDIDNLQARVDAWVDQFEKIKQLASTDIAKAMEQVNKKRTGLADQAFALQQHARDWLVEQSAETVRKLSQETMEEMGYKVKIQREKDLYSLHGRKGGQQIFAAITDGGQVALKFHGFGDDKCLTEMRDFLRRLEKKGVKGAWQEKFILSKAVQNLVRMLQQHGLNVKVEPSEDGMIVTADGAVRSIAQVDYDGRVRGNEKFLEMWKEQVRISQVIEEPDTESEWIAKQRRELEQWERLRIKEFAR